LSKLVKLSKSTTCVLDPIPTKLLKEKSRSSRSRFLNIVNLSLLNHHL